MSAEVFAHRNKQCDMGCNEDGKKKSNDTHGNERAAQDSQDSFHEHLGGRGLSSLEPFDVMHLKARVIHVNARADERMPRFGQPRRLHLLQRKKERKRAH